LADGDEEFAQLIVVEDAVVVPVEEEEVFLILFLFFDRDVFLYFLFAVVLVLVDRSQLSDLSIGRYFGEVVHERNLFSDRFGHKFQLIQLL
jgi:hypothetical protein